MLPAMTAQDILNELQPLGKASYKRVLMNNHGVREPCFGVAISELQTIRKRIKKTIGSRSISTPPATKTRCISLV
jgi:hypothetical protein